MIVGGIEHLQRLGHIECGRDGTLKRVILQAERPEVGQSTQRWRDGAIEGVEGEV